MTFASPLYFLLLLLLIPFVLWHFLLSRKHEPTITMATTEPVRHLPPTPRTALIHLPFLVRLLAYSLLVVCLARPQTRHALTDSETEGIDIMMAVDISVSMLTNDMQPNRIEAAKQVATEFIANRPNDAIGLTLFAGEAFTQCPLTTDHATLLGMFRHVNCNLQQAGVISEGTAIGMGIASAVSHLEQSQAKSKVVILLTDGENNTGDISPLMAADLAKQLKVRVYTISLGSDGGSQQVAVLPNGQAYNAQVGSGGAGEASLRQIAEGTGGLFYKARSTQKLREIYNDIDQLEKTKLKVTNYERRYEAFMPFAAAAMLCLLLEILLRITWFRRIP